MTCVQGGVAMALSKKKDFDNLELEFDFKDAAEGIQSSQFYLIMLQCCECAFCETVS